MYFPVFVILFFLGMGSLFFPAEASWPFGCPRLLQSPNPTAEINKIEAEWIDLLRASDDDEEIARTTHWEAKINAYVRSRNTYALLQRRYVMLQPEPRFARLPWRRLDASEYQYSEVYFIDGLVRDGQGELITTDRNGEPKFAIFTMDDRGRVRIWKDPVPGDVHHTSLGTLPEYWRGIRPPMIAAAGEIRILKGHILAINDKSGHYAPPAILLGQFLDRLWLAGIPWRDLQGNALIDVRLQSQESWDEHRVRNLWDQGIPEIAPFRIP